MKVTPNQWDQKSRYKEKIEYEKRQRINSEYDQYKDSHLREEVVMDQNTIYEIDLDCYDCLMREKRKLSEILENQSRE